MQSTSLKYFWLLSALALLAVAAPFIGVQSPPLADYPNHMARFHVLQNLDASPELQQYYYIRDGFYPYMSIATFMKVFTPIFGVEGAGRMFAVLAIFMPVFGSLALSRAIAGKVSVLALAMIPFALSGLAGWGFLNFLFSAGLVLIIFAGWIKTTLWPAAIRVAVFAVFALATSAMHLISVAFLGLLIGFWELYPVITRGRILKKDVRTFANIALLFVPAGLLILTQLGGEFGSSKTVYGNLANKSDVLNSPLSMFGGAAEIIIAVAIIFGAAALYKLKIIALNYRLCFVGIGLYLLGVLVPFQLFGVAYVGIRFPLFALAVILAGITVIDNSKIKIAAVILAVLIAGKLFIIRDVFTYADTQTAELRAAMKDLPAGTKILPVLDRQAANQSPVNVPTYFHQPAYMVIERDGLFPYFFAMFNIGVKDEHADYTRLWESPVRLEAFDTPDARSYSKTWRDDFDYVLVMDNDNKPFAHADLTPLSAGSWFKILRVEPRRAP